MLDEYRKHAEERKKMGIPPLPLSVEQTKEVCEQLKNPPAGEENFLLHLLADRVSPGVDPAAKIKSAFLTRIARGEDQSPLIDKIRAVELLGTMLGGYNISPLIEFLSAEELAVAAAAALSNTLLIYDQFDEIKELAAGNSHAERVMASWANAGWFLQKEKLPQKITLIAYKVDGEINTDDFSPATHASTRPDIPLHALAMGESRFPDGIRTITGFREKGHTIAFVGDVVGTGSSRKSACNSLIWHIGEEIPYVPNKRRGGVILGGAIAPIFFNTAEDSGALPLICDVSKFKTGMIINVYPMEGKITDEHGHVLSTFELKPETLADEYRAGGRVNLIIGRDLTNKARQALQLGETNVFVKPAAVEKPSVGFSQAQKIVGRACGMKGVHPGAFCTPKMATVGSQDTTGPMTADEMKELACLNFTADLVMQSFCHTAAYPKPADIKTHHTLPTFISERGGVALQPGDGVIHSWLNRMILPDTVGTGGDSHTRFPIGVSFPAGSGLVAFAAALGIMPLEMPESVLVRFRGSLRPGITLRDLVNAVPYYAIQKGLLTAAKQGKKNVFNGRIIELEGLPDLKVEQAFELTDASAERSAAAGVIQLHKEPIAEFLRSNITLLKTMIADGYQSADALKRRIEKMEEWLAHPVLIERDQNAQYAAELEIDLNDITEPILACPNDPDDVKLLSAVQNDPVHEVFIGSCMTNIGHFRAAAKILDGSPQTPVRLWICPPTRMDELQLREEGLYAIFCKAGARIEIPGCSLCMGNQARVADKTTVFSTSTRNFDNRMGNGARVYLGSAELAAVTAMLGRLPTVDEYLAVIVDKIQPTENEIYRYLNFDRIEEYAERVAMV
ncbi:MAG: bifunctional aconitate hydratase 2/2-methylisocitrate dehydratase [Candidatus Omnitrophota bacterium]|jgi:aconitate hydratase 2/2-methylisocitrate dehydratase|nr:MAG: bifunctional aconitate hydratase 2/2-methylisocitrate dehydratase [Candidatus Omnitrophota bacterium]